MEPLEDRRLLAVFTVNSTLTLGDSFQGDGLCDTANDPTTDPPTPPSGICTLRAAAAESSDTEGNDEIKFDIEAEGVPVIESNAAFTESSVEIDGTTQAGGKVLIKGTLTFIGDGGHTVKGLVINEGGLRFLSSGNTIIGNFIGTNDDATEAAPGAAGVELFGDTNRIGGIEAEDRNIIVGDVVIRGTNNHVFGNYFGTDITGEEPLANNLIGVQILSGEDNEIGGDEAEKGNVFSSANGNGAIRIGEFGSGDVPRRTIIRHNFIGTNKDGTVALGNLGAGIIVSNSTDNLIRDNVIAAGRSPSGVANVSHGVVIGNQAHRNQVQGNRIGTRADGLVVDPDGTPQNGDEFGHNGIGVLISGGNGGATGNVVGGPTEDDANVISGNMIGVKIMANASGNTVGGNFIGTDAAGLVALPNGVGVSIEFAGQNVIGGGISRCHFRQPSTRRHHRWCRVAR